MRRTLISKPYEVEMVHDDHDRLVAVNIRAVGDGGELGYDEIREATRAIITHTRPSPLERMNASDKPPVLRTQGARDLKKAYEGGNGRVTDEYLARLSAVYEDLLARGSNVSMSLAMSLEMPLQTIKGHVMRARREGFLTETVEGKEGGEATPKARELIAKLAET
jgi:hypothetical protein